MKPRSVEVLRIAAYFAKRHDKSFCKVYCVNYRELSDSCEVLEREWEPVRCPHYPNLKEAA